MFAHPYYYNRKPERESKRTTSQSIRDHERVRIRVNNAGVQLGHVTEYLESLFGPHVTVYSLLKQANILSERLGLTIDRLATRNRSALFCWFTENWDQIYKYLPTQSDSHKLQYIQPKLQSMHPKIQCKEIDLLDLSNLLNYH